MKYLLQNDGITLYFKGEITSFNALDIEREVEDTLSGKTFNSIVLDFNDLEYASSAGLRIILKLKQKYKDVVIINASSNVFEILEMTGFTNIMDVKKQMLEISVDGCKVIGTGFFSTVYRLDQDTIIKVFERNTDIKDIERELKLAKEAFIQGIPTAISFDVVKVNGKYGVRFEMLDCMSLRDAFKLEDKYDYYLKKYVELLKTINGTECFDDNVPSMNKAFMERVKSLKDVLEPAIYQKAYDLVSGLEETNTFIHGDCHFKNIMVQGEDLILIDMDTLSQGNYLFELALMRAPYVAFEEDDPGNSERFLGMPGAFVQKLYNDILNLYLEDKSEKLRDKIAILCYIHMVWWTTVNDKDNQKRFNGCKERLIKLLEKF